NDTGYYTIADGLGTGTYTIYASYGNGFSQLIGVNVVQGSQTSNVNLQITQQPIGTITGRVTNSSSLPVIFAYVNAQGDSSYGSDYTDAYGDYSLTVEVAGTYNVTVTANGYASKNQTSVSAKLDQITPNINFQLKDVPSGRISGLVQSIATPIPELHGELYPILFFVCASIVLLAKKVKTH
ncbi:MAG TPA: carboxypeptidase-like regulatory domain-containing protein, partial [Candidatus Bathyarchaeia archaeon]